MNPTEKENMKNKQKNQENAIQNKKTKEVKMDIMEKTDEELLIEDLKKQIKDANVVYKKNGELQTQVEILKGMVDDMEIENDALADQIVKSNRALVRVINSMPVEEY